MIAFFKIALFGRHFEQATWNCDRKRVQSQFQVACSKWRPKNAISKSIAEGHDWNHANRILQWKVGTSSLGKCQGYCKEILLLHWDNQSRTIVQLKRTLILREDNSARLETLSFLTATVVATDRNHWNKTNVFHLVYHPNQFMLGQCSWWFVFGSKQLLTPDITELFSLASGILNCFWCWGLTDWIPICNVLAHEGFNADQDI